jgi:hypothetical protein
MRAALIIVGVVIVGLITVKVLGTTLAPPEYEKQDLGITGPLAIDQVSSALETRAVWREPRGSHSVQDRKRLLVGNIEHGDVFQVTNHARKGSTIWIHIECRNRPELVGWVASPADDPFKAGGVE